MNGHSKVAIAAMCAALLGGAGCKGREMGKGTGSGSAAVGSGSAAVGSGSAATGSDGAGSAVAAGSDTGSDTGSGEAPAVGSASDTGSGSDAGSGSAAPAGDAKNPLTARQLNSLMDAEAAKSVTAVAKAIVADDLAGFVATIGPDGYSHGGKKMTADEVKAAAASSLRAWLGWTCAATPASCKWNPKLDGIDMTLSGAGAPTLTFGLTPDGTWPLTGDKPAGK